MVWILIIFLYKEVLLRDKSDLDSGLKTKNSSLALLSYLYKLYSERYGELLYFGISSINSEKEKSANIQQEHLVEIFLCYVCKHEKIRAKVKTSLTMFLFHDSMLNPRSKQ